MNIDYSRLRSLTAREVNAALLSNGFILKRQRGSHRRFLPLGRTARHTDLSPCRRHIPPRHIAEIIEVQARWTEEDLRRLGLLK